MWPFRPKLIPSTFRVTSKTYLPAVKDTFIVDKMSGKSLIPTPLTTMPTTESWEFKLTGQDVKGSTRTKEVYVDQVTFNSVSEGDLFDWTKYKSQE